MKKHVLRLIALFILSSAVFSSCSVEYREHHGHHDQDHDHDHEHYRNY